MFRFLYFYNSVFLYLYISLFLYFYNGKTLHTRGHNWPFRCLDSKQNREITPLKIIIIKNFMHLKVLRFLKQCLSSDLLLDSLWCVELQTPHKQKEMRRNCHRKILEKKISVLMKVFGFPNLSLPRREAPSWNTSHPTWLCSRKIKISHVH